MPASSVAPLDQLWSLRLETVKKALERNRFAVSLVPDVQAAADLVMNTLLPESGAKSASSGGSMTLARTGIMERLAAVPGLEVIDTRDMTPPAEERIERRRRSLLVDLYLTSSNAVTMDGKLVNLDGTGNRVAALTFGPRKVIVLVGRNKLCDGVHEAFRRVRAVAAPANTLRLTRAVPCVQTGICADCNSPERICNTWTITAKPAPAGRTHVVLINEDLGY